MWWCVGSEGSSHWVSIRFLALYLWFSSSYVINTFFVELTELTDLLNKSYNLRFWVKILGATTDGVNRGELKNVMFWFLLPTT